MQSRSVKSTVLTWANEGDTVSKMLFSILVGLTISGILMQERGLTAIPHGILVYMPTAIAVFLSVVISPEAYDSGYGHKHELWHSLGKRLLILLSAALVLRGIAVALVAYWIGLDRHLAILIGTGLTATDPAAIGVTQAVSGRTDNPVRLEDLFWLYAIESLANDGIASFVFELAEGKTLSILLPAILFTLFLGGALALSDEGTRWYIREKSRWAYSPREAKIEIGAVIALYFSFALVAGYFGAFPIFTVVIGAVIANYFFIHRIPDERYTEEIQHQREHYAHLWMEWGLACYLAMAVALMPFREILGTTQYLIGGLCLLAVGLGAARLVYELGYLVYDTDERRQPLAMELSTMSVLLASTLLGVPTFVGVTLFEQGHEDAAYYVFATVLESWLIVPFAVIFISFVRGKLKQAELVTV